MSEEESRQEDGHGKAYWFFKNFLSGTGNFARNHTKLFLVITFIAVLLFLAARGYIHLQVIYLRKHFGLFLATVFLTWLVWRLLSRGSWKTKIATISVVILGLGFAYEWGKAVHQYLALYYRYKTLPMVELDKLPLTDHERIQPLNSVYSLAHEVSADTQSPTLPDFIRVGENRYNWSMGIEPTYWWNKTFGHISSLYSVQGTTASPDFSEKTKIPVNFGVGEGLNYGRNTYVAVVRAFGFWRFLNYEPDTVMYVPDDNGEWVQVVPLIRWTGILFPWPEFGGVQVIRQHEQSIVHSLIRSLVGVGEWVRPEDIEKHPYLAGQNILSYKVSRFMANGFRFHGGFWAPFPGNHEGDIRIPDLPMDMNDLPFTIYLNFDEGVGQSKLYHYFSLEPYNIGLQGLNISVFIPADGERKVYIYRHYTRNEALIGVSSVAAKVMESRKQNDWNRNKPVENRPWIHEFRGKRPFFWLTTVVTIKDDSSRIQAVANGGSQDIKPINIEPGSIRFIAGSHPDVILTDANYKMPIWLKPPLDPKGWPEQVEAAMADHWNSEK